MKLIWSVLLTIAANTNTALAQFQAYDEGDKPNAFRLGAGFTHDFPGMNGYTLLGEYVRRVGNRFEVAAGGKFINTQGFPRTQTVQEHTRALTVDLNVFFLPVISDYHTVRIGLGNAFSFYNYRRAYPVITDHGGEQVTNWEYKDGKGSLRSFSIIADYEYALSESVGIGIRGALYAAKEKTIYAGPYISMKF
jgi:hypothetical protein